jgi:hypothetical protein
VRIQFSGAGFVGGAIENLACGWLNLLTEIKTGSVLHVFEKIEIIVAEKPGVGRLRSRGLLCRGLLRQREGRGYEAGKEGSSQ